MEDCHDCIEAAVAVKHRFVSLVQLAGVDNKVLFSCLVSFEDELAEVFKVFVHKLKKCFLNLLTKE